MAKERPPRSADSEKEQVALLKAKKRELEKRIEELDKGFTDIEFEWRKDKISDNERQKKDKNLEAEIDKIYDEIGEIEHKLGLFEYED